MKARDRKRYAAAAAVGALSNLLGYGLAVAISKKQPSTPELLLGTVANVAGGVLLGVITVKASDWAEES